MQRNKNRLRFFRLVGPQAADTRRKNRFRIPQTRPGHAAEPLQRGGAVASSVINLSERKRRVGPIRFEACGFPEFARPGVIFIGEQTANVMFERIEPQRPLEFRKVRQVQGKGAFVASQQFPHCFRVEIHQRIQFPRFLHDRLQSGWIDAQDARLQRQRISVGMKLSEDDKVNVEFGANAQHRRMAQSRARRQSVAIEFRSAPRVRINLLPGGRKPLNGQLFQSFAEPIKARTCAGIFERKDQENSLAAQMRRRFWSLSADEAGGQNGQ